METMVIALVLSLLIFAVAVWAIGMLPVGNSGFPFKAVLYGIAALLLIFYWIRFLP